jgi:signal transduction histidine kinase/HD-like signal output (HDOD) protein
MPDLREKRVELILQQLEELPTLPAVALRVLQITGDDHSSAKDVIQLISSDPPLAARILQLTRRADAGVREPASIERAVALLGFDAVRSAVLAISVFQTFSVPREGEGHAGIRSKFNREEFWAHCLAVGCCAELLAEAKPGGAGAASMTSPSEAFLCGLLHDVGKVALDAVLPKSFSRTVEAADLLRGNIADVERGVIGLDHMVVGKRLAERWRLPAAIRECAWLHGQPPQALPAGVRNPRLVNLITLADMLAREQHLGYSGNYTFPISRQSLLEAVGLSAAQAASAMSHLVERIEPRAKALGLGQASADELYQHALAQANRELGRVSSQLAAKNRKLSVRSRFFDALSHFQAGLRPDAAAQAVLHSIASTAVGALGVNAVAAFSLPPGQEYAETLLCDDKGELFETSLVDLPGSLRPTQPGATVGTEANGVEVPVGSALRTVITTNGESTREADPTRIAKPQADARCEAQVQNEIAPHQLALAPGDGPVLPAGASVEWLVSAISPRLSHDKRFWICLEADGACVGGVLWGAPAGEAQRLSPQALELCALGNAWSLALRTAQVREEARTLAEQLADANRRLHDAQNELLRSKAMLSVGEMAAGAAHEMNNPLAVISGRSQLLAQQLSDPKHRAMAHLIHEQSHRLSSIITELMDFARPELPVTRECELSDMVQRALHEAKRHNDPADRAIEVTMGDVPLVCVDERQVSAAMAEVLDNAIQATHPAKGQIAIHAAYDAYSGKVVVSIADDGCGMDEGTAKRAFDPFFSNKPAGRRRGLGLAKALRWIESSGGSIQLESRVGKGTRAVILLPVGQAGSAPEEAAPRRRAAQ